MGTGQQSSYFMRRRHDVRERRVDLQDAPLPEDIVAEWWEPGDGWHECVDFLRTVGTVEELEAFIRDLIGFKTAVDALCFDPAKPRGGWSRVVIADLLAPLLDEMETVYHRILAIQERVQDAEDQLEASGYRYNTGKKLVEFVSGGRGGPRHIFRDEVAKKYDEFWPAYRADTCGKIFHNPKEVRERIAEALAPYFPAACFKDLSAHGKIGRAIDDHISGKR